jgi:hypothetical protein
MKVFQSDFVVLQPSSAQAGWFFPQRFCSERIQLG